MSKLIQTIQEEKSYLEKMKGKVVEDLKQDRKDKLVGNLRIQKKGNSTQYYHTGITSSQKTEVWQLQDKTAHRQLQDKVVHQQDALIPRGNSGQEGALIPRGNSVQEDALIPRGNSGQVDALIPEGNLQQEYTSKGKISCVQEYIPKKNIKLARDLAQRDYDNKLIQEIEQRQKILNRFIGEYPREELEEIYAGMNNYRRELIHPIIETDEQYAKIWINAPYVRKIVGDDVPEIFTENGERVRSKSEKMIADKLKHLNIPYRYEAPLRLGRSTVLHPDFTLLNVKERKEIYYEHFGMMDNPEYMDSALKRIELYEKNGIFPGDKLLFSWETLATPLNMKIVEGMLKKFLI